MESDKGPSPKKCITCTACARKYQKIYTDFHPKFSGHRIFPTDHINRLLILVARWRAHVDHLAGLDGGEDTGLAGTLGDGLGLVSGGGSLEFLADGLDGSGAGAGDGSSVAEVGVDADEGLAVVGLDVLDGDLASDRVLAVSA